MNKRKKNADIKIMGLKDKFLDKYGTQQELLEYSRLGYKDLYINMKIFIGKKLK